MRCMRSPLSLPCGPPVSKLRRRRSSTSHQRKFDGRCRCHRSLTLAAGATVVLCALMIAVLACFLPAFRPSGLRATTAWAPDREARDPAGGCR